MPKWSQFWLSDYFSPHSLSVHVLIDYYLVLFILVLTYIFSYYVLSVFNKVDMYYSLDRSYLELMWTVIPVITLVGISMPSVHLLYLLEDSYYFSLSVKVLASQWFWSYEYSDFSTFNFSSYMLVSEDLSFEDFRLLDVDNRLVLPMMMNIRLVFTSTDVIHSFSIPALYMKMDCVPGRLNQAYLMLNTPGLYFGQCSEICGSNHSFMPIVMEAVSVEDYVNWVQ